jgi:hypothetical protein
VILSSNAYGPDNPALDPPEDGFDPLLLNILGQAVARLRANLRASAPEISGDVIAWVEGLSRTGHAEDYFRDGRAWMFLLPWYVEKTVHAAPDPEFHAELVYSTIHAYYFIRLIDNLMDGGGDPELRLLPVAAYFHGQHQASYARWFPLDHSFWEFFHRTWTAMAQATILDAAAEEVSLDDLVRVGVAKSAGGKIPIAAVCHRLGRTDLLEPWCRFHDELACWNRMVDDVLDAVVDARNGTVTYLLSEGRRRRHEGESVTAWVVRDGFAWGYREAQSRVPVLRELAVSLGSPDLLRHLAYREAEVARCWERTRPVLGALAGVARVMEQ